MDYYVVEVNDDATKNVPLEIAQRCSDGRLEAVFLGDEHLVIG
jgi:hypothetical protein